MYLDQMQFLLSISIYLLIYPPAWPLVKIQSKDILLDLIQTCFTRFMTVFQNHIRLLHIKK